MMWLQCVDLPKLAQSLQRAVEILIDAGNLDTLQSFHGLCTELVKGFDDCVVTSESFQAIHATV